MEELSRTLVEFIRLQQEQSQSQQLAMANTQQEFMARVTSTLLGNADQLPQPARPDAEFRMESLGQSISEFEFALDSGITFEAWYGRYESLFSEDAVNLSDQAKTRLAAKTKHTMS